jgi:hypothetical protein
MKRVAVASGTVLVLLTTMSPALAAANPSGTGQPSQTCVDTSTAANEPGHGASAPGSAFNETSPGTAGAVYAGNRVSATKAGSGNAVSQYDVACFQVTQKP